MAKKTVEIQPPMSYVPASVEINAGDTVEWVSRDSTDVHTVTADYGSFNSTSLNENDTFAHTFAAAGDVPYHCRVHGPGMAGVVKVKATAAARHTVEITSSMTYSPDTLQINAGDTVEWVSWDSTDVHTVTSNDGTTFSSVILNENDTFAHTFTAAGNFPYHCKVHGSAMAGVINVT